MADLLTLYGVPTRERERLLGLAATANEPGWWHRFNDMLPSWFQAYVGLEEAAARIRTYEVQFVPGCCRRGVRPRGHHARPRRASRPRRSNAGSTCAWSASACSTSPTAPLLGGHRRGGAAPPHRRRRGDAGAARAPARPHARSRTSRSRSCRSASAATAPRAAPFSILRFTDTTCPTWSTSSSSPAPSTWTSARTSTATARSWSGCARSAPPRARRMRSCADH